MNRREEEIERVKDQKRKKGAKNQESFVSFREAELDASRCLSRIFIPGPMYASCVKQNQIESERNWLRFKKKKWHGHMHRHIYIKVYQVYGVIGELIQILATFYTHVCSANVSNTHTMDS